MNLEHLKELEILETVRRAFEQSGGEVFVVGGTLRDALIGRPLNDIDIVIRGVPAETIEDTLATIGKVNLVGKKFAVYKLTTNTVVIDVAMPRIDESFGTGKYRDVTVSTDQNMPIEKDLQRRDFTINAMAWKIASQTIIDPYGGQVDIQNKTIRCVGEPRLRFQEDATRMLRAIRLAVQLNFSIEIQTMEAIQEKRHLLNESSVSRHVLRTELMRAATANPGQTLELCDQLHVTELLLPDLGRLENNPERTTLIQREGLLSLIKKSYGS